MKSPRQTIKKKEKTMKKILSLSVTTLLLTVVLAPVSAADTSIRRQSTKFWEFGPLKSEEELNKLPDNSMIAMACSKCQSVVVMQKRQLGTKPGHGTQVVGVSVHRCPGCGGKMERKVGTKQVAWVHTCSQCGDESPFCCATTRGEATRGM
jgi:predicted RNA-binding Zn-ribbon protein involved in translation (DUF1610 family)